MNLKIRATSISSYIMIIILAIIMPTHANMKDLFNLKNVFDENIEIPADIWEFHRRPLKYLHKDLVPTEIHKITKKY